MTSLIPYFIAGLCLVIGIILWRQTSPHSCHGGDSYEWRARLRVFAAILFALALICGLYAVVGSVANYFNAPLFPAPTP